MNDQNCILRNNALEKNITAIGDDVSPAVVE